MAPFGDDGIHGRAHRGVVAEVALERERRAAVGADRVGGRARDLRAARHGSTPGPEGSIDKLLVTRAEQLVSHVTLAVRGAAPILDAGPDIESSFWSRAQSILGGTQQIQRNIAAQRILGLPRG